MENTGDRLIVMSCDDLAHLLASAKEYKYYYQFDSDQNRDGQGEWHCDVEFGDEPLSEDSWGDGDDKWSFDSLDNHLCKFGKAMEKQAEVQSALLDMVKGEPSEPPLQECLENIAEQFDDFYCKAQEFIDKEKEKQK